MSKNPSINSVKIENLRIEYRNLIAQAFTKKDKFFEFTKKANEKLGKIHVIKEKLRLKSKYGKEHGISDDVYRNINGEIQ